jgi:hypothetical protein
MEPILAFITPGPLAERCGFSTRVLTSWLSLGLVLGLVLGIIGLSSGTADPASAFFGSLFAGPIIICVFGLLGLGISSLRGDSNYHSGWYWYLFPIVTYIIVGFSIVFAIISFALALAGVNLPKPSHSSPEIDPEELRKKLENMKVEELLKKFREQLEELENKRKLDPEQEKVVRKLRTFDRSKYDHRLRDVFDEEELGELILLLLILLGVEVR